MERGGDVQPQTEFLRALAISHPAWDKVGPLTLHLSKGVPKPWTDWRATVWDPLFKTQIEEAREALALGDWKTLQIIARKIEEGLSPGLAERSQASGRRLLANYPVPAGERLWKRLRDRLETGEFLPHLLLVMAIRAQAFHLPQGQLVRSYLLIEASGASLDPASSREFIQDCDQGPAEPLLRVA